MSWTPKRWEKCKTMWLNGESAGAIAATLGGFEHTRDGGRSAVMGKINRMGLGGKTKKDRTSAYARSSERKPQTLSRPNGNAGAPRPAGQEAIPVEQPAPLLHDDPEFIGPLYRPSILELTETTCRWPLGGFDEPTTRFCGANSKRGQPYCDFHMRVAYPPRAKKPEPDPNRPYQPATPTQEAING